MSEPMLSAAARRHIEAEIVHYRKVLQHSAGLWPSDAIYLEAFERLLWLEATTAALRAELAQVRAEQRRGEEALRAALPIIEELSVEESYGAPYCDDPRDFRPDRECNTPAEIAAWEEACRRAEAGETVEVPRHQWISGEPAQVREAVTTAVQEGASSGSVSKRADGMAIGHIASEPWGVGVSTVRDSVMARLAETIRAALAPSPDAPTREGER